MIIPFYSHLSKGDSGKSHACFSQFFSSSFEIKGLHFPTAEHYMMYAKACLFGDATLADRVLKARSAFAAMELGREVNGFDEAIWVNQRRALVYAGNFAKFQQNSECRNSLKETGDACLAFASSVDLIWGTGLSQQEHLSLNAVTWPGENLLGNILMEVRKNLADS